MAETEGARERETGGFDELAGTDAEALAVLRATVRPFTRSLTND
jgi:hypothetical protein